MADPLDQIAAKYAGGGDVPPARDPLDAIAEKYVVTERPKVEMPSQPVKIGADAFPDTLRQVLQDTNWGTRNIAAAGTALTNLWEGAKQLVGQSNQQNIRNNKIIRDEAPVGAVLGDAALTAIPFGLAGNSVRAAGAVGAGTGLLSPVEATNNLDAIKGKAIGTVVGGGLGAGGQVVANQAANMLANRTAALAAQRSQNAPIDATIREAIDAGYVIPPGQVNPTFLNRQLESVGGKIATQQMASSRNAEVTDRLARTAASLGANDPITPQTLRAARQVIQQPYREVANLGYQAELDALDAARAEARAAWNEYSRQGTRAALNDYRTFNQQAQTIEQNLENALQGSGHTDLMQRFRDARRALARNHNVETALVEGSGNVDARAIARMTQRGDPLTGELATIGNFANNFPKIAQPDKAIGTPDAHNLKYVTSLLMGGGGGAAFGPLGIAAGALPMISGPAARSIMFSRPVQRGLLNDYTVGVLPRVGSGLLSNAPVGGTVLGLNALNQ